MINKDDRSNKKLVARDFETALSNLTRHVRNLVRNAIHLLSMFLNPRATVKHIEIFFRTRSQKPRQQDGGGPLVANLFQPNAYVVNFADSKMNWGTSANQLNTGQSGPINTGTSNGHVVFFHAHFKEEALEIANKLQGFHFADVVITSSKEDLLLELGRILANTNTILLLVDNRGRDVLPFLLALQIMDLGRYQTFSKIHTKRSSHLKSGSSWGVALVESVLKETSTKNGWLSQVEKLALPAIGGTKAISALDHYKNNRKWLKYLFKKDEIATAKFIPGTMFVGNSAFLELIKRQDFLNLKFESERGQLDGSLAHALERAFGILVCRMGGLVSSFDPLSDGEI